MNRIFFLCGALLIIVLTNCSTHKKLTYNIPDNIEPGIRKNFLMVLERGKRLYEGNCAKCHGIFTKGREGVPNFSDQQIDNYTAWAIRLDTKNHAVAAHLNSDQLREVFTFLKALKRKSDKKLPTHIPVAEPEK